MDEDARWRYLGELDDELLVGDAVFSEWAVFVTQQADIAFAKGADLASILTAVSAIETYLRTEYGGSGGMRLVDLIDACDLASDLKAELHHLRRYRNRWVHLSEEDDEAILTDPAKYRDELEWEAVKAARLLRRTLCSNQGV